MPLHDLNARNCEHCNATINLDTPTYFICWSHTEQRHIYWHYGEYAYDDPTPREHRLNCLIASNHSLDQAHQRHCLAGYNPRGSGNNAIYWTRASLWTPTGAPGHFGRNLTREEFFALPTMPEASPVPRDTD